MMRVIFAFIIVSGVCLPVTPQQGFCRTPLGDPGICININDCEGLLYLLRTQNANKELRSFLNRANCGFEGDVPKVCCPQVSTKLSTEPTPATILTPEPPTRPPTPRPAETTVEPVVTEAPVVTSAPVHAGLLQPPLCGYSNLSNTRVVGGEPANLGEFPWIVVLGYKNAKNPSSPKWLCGGSLISEKHILTAAHCVYNRPDLYLARLGELDLYSDDDGANPITIPLIKAKVHEEYSASSHTNDIAVLTMAQKVSHPGVWPICLPVEPTVRNNLFVKYKLFVAGWGSLYFNGPAASVLQKVQLPVVTNAQCRTAFTSFKDTVIDDRVLCAGYSTGGQDACQGDSGGPLMYGRAEQTNIRFYQIGVVSYGFKCAEVGYPGVYTRVSLFVDWIEKNLN